MKYVKCSLLTLSSAAAIWLSLGILIYSVQKEDWKAIFLAAGIGASGASTFVAACNELDKKKTK
jgi:hypothetical protein